MSDSSSSVIAWEEGEPAQTLLAPEQALEAVVSSRLGQVFFLTEDGRVYLSTLKQDGLSGKLQELALPCQTVVGIGCNMSHVIFVSDRGKILRSELSTPEKVEELIVKKPSLCCPHGFLEEGERLLVREVASHSNFTLFVSDTGQIWAFDENKNLQPDQIPAFKNKAPISIHSGSNFCVALIEDSQNPEESISKSSSKTPKTGRDSVDGSVLAKAVSLDRVPYVGSCQECREASALTNNRDRSGDQKSDKDTKDISNTLAQVCWSKADHLVRQSAILLNSTPQLGDAAKQFLTRQLSWVTGSAESDEGNPSSPASLSEPNKVTQQVANRVAEGVRSLGDAVSRMSRHWSATSQDEAQGINSQECSFETTSLPAVFGEDSPAAPGTPNPLFRQALERNHRWKRNGSSSLSLDSTLGRFREAKSLDVNPGRLVTAGKRLLLTSVWTWGQGGVGQLGLSDCVSRDTPTLVRPLQGIGIAKISCGSRHTLALTLDGRVFAWGANNKGQIRPGEDLTFISSPTEISLPFRTTIRDIAAGREYSLLLSTYGEVLFVGFSMATQKSTLMRLNLPAQSPSGRCSRIWASGPLSCCLRCCQHCCCWPHLAEYLLSEQLFLRSCLKTSQTVVDQLDTATSISTPSHSHSQVRRELFQHFRDLVACVALNVQSILELSDCSSTTNALVRCIDDYVQVWKGYGRTLANAIAVNALSLTKNESHSLERNASEPILPLMAEPIDRLTELAEHLDKLAESHLYKQDASSDNYKRTSYRCLETHAILSADCKAAETTRLFWESCSVKFADALRTPERRLIRESRAHPINLLNSGRFSSHWFIVLTDVLVHVSGYSGHTAYPLATIWVEPIQDNENSPTKNCLVVTMPEEVITLTCNNATDKGEWVNVLQSAIKQALNQQDSSANNGRVTPPLVRNASYTFTKLPHLKDVTYTGAWLCGKMHGEGELHWPDGRLYRGSFRHNHQYGYGFQESPGPNGTFYEGEWKDGKMNGYGVLKYANGDIYEGNFQDGLPHGHGRLKRGHFLTSAAHLYVGQWEAGQKNGYGVMDDIVTGEKYMGLWLNDAKHGKAVLVTLDGLYIEGSFTNNKMAGQCVMLLDDGTSYEGEVAGVGVMGGKGVLKMPNGDVIQGSFHGSWSEGVKISGTMTKVLPLAQSPAIQADLLCSYPTDPPLSHSGVPADRKWEAVFHQCMTTLGLSLDNSQWTLEDTKQAWDQIAAALTQTKHRAGNDLSRSKVQQHRRQGSSVSSKSVKSDRVPFGCPVNLDLPETLQRIPDYGRNQLDVVEFRKIEEYLAKAFDSMVHPLGRMLSQLSDVYRATYVGVGAHPRLLPHAVAEVRSFVSRIYNIVRVLFPALPIEDRPAQITPDESRNDHQELPTVISANSLLLPSLLPRLYPPLHTLYVLHNQKLDDLYWERLQKWNRQSDSALMNFLGVDSKFVVEEYSTQDAHFSGAVDCLQQLSTAFAPREKLNVIHQTFQEVSRAVQAHLGTEYVMNMDDLFPVFLYVVVRSRIRHLGTEIHLIDDFIDRNVQNGELDVMFTTLEASYQYIQHEKMTCS